MKQVIADADDICVRTTDCTVTPDQSWAATEVGGTDLTCRKHLTANIVSWICA